MARKVLTIGTFDVPHLGHANFIRKCAEYGDLVIGINSDRFVNSYKKRSAVYTQAERAELMSLLGHPIAINDGPGRALIETIKPDLIAVSTDWVDRDYLAQIDVTREFLEDNNISLVYIPHTRGVSTTDIRERLTPRTDVNE